MRVHAVCACVHMYSVCVCVCVCARARSHACECACVLLLLQKLEVTKHHLQNEARCQVVNKADSGD